MCGGWGVYRLEKPIPSVVLKLVHSSMTIPTYILEAKVRRGGWGVQWYRTLKGKITLLGVGGGGGGHGLEKPISAVLRQV